MNLTKFAGALRRQYLIVGAVLLLGACVFAGVMFLGRSYEATANVIAFGSSDPTAHGSDPLKDPSSAAVSPQDVLSLVHSSPLLAAVARSTGLDPAFAKSLKKRIKAKNTLGSEVISITVSDKSAARAILTVNAVTQQLRDFESQLATARYDGLIRDLREQLKSGSKALRQIDSRIAAVTTGDPYLNADTGAAQINQKLVGLQQQLDQIQTTAGGDASALAVISRRPALTKQLAGSEIVAGDPAFTARRAQLGKDLAQRDQTEAGYTTAFPGLIGLNDQVARESARLRRAERAATVNPSLSASYVAAQLDANKAAAAYASDRAQIDALDSEIAEAKDHLDQSRSDAVHLAALRRERDATGVAFAALSARLASTLADRSQAASIGTVVIVDPAVEATPTLLSQPVALALILVTVFGWLAITLALAVDSLDTRLHDGGAVERLYGKPVLTTV